MPGQQYADLLFHLIDGRGGKVHTFESVDCSADLFFGTRDESVHTPDYTPNLLSVESAPAFNRREHQTSELFVGCAIEEATPQLRHGGDDG